MRRAADIAGAPQASYSNEGRSVPTAIGVDEPALSTPTAAPAPAATATAAPAAPPKVLTPEGPYPMSTPSNPNFGTAPPTTPVVPAGETGVRAFKMDNGQKMFTNVDGNAAAVAGLSAANAPAGAAVANSMPAPKVAPAAPSVAMNPALVNMQQQLMSQFQAAQDVVSQGSNRAGYKMGDVTKALGTMQHLNTAMSSVNNLVGQTYGVDAGMVNHTADNAARIGIANAGNATELTKADVAGQYALQGHKLTADGAINLATHKAGLEKTTPEGILNGIKAKQAELTLKDDLSQTTAQRIENRFAPTHKILTDASGNYVGMQRNGNVLGLNPQDRAALTTPKKEK